MCENFPRPPTRWRYAATTPPMRLATVYAPGQRARHRLCADTNHDPRCTAPRSCMRRRISYAFQYHDEFVVATIKFLRSLMPAGNIAPLIRSCRPRTAVIRPGAVSMSSTVLIAEDMPGSARVTATAAPPVAEPSCPASGVPEPCGASAAAHLATLTPWLPASCGSEPPVMTSAAFAAGM